MKHIYNSKCGVSDDMTPVQDAEQSVDEHVPTPFETKRCVR